MRFIEPHIHMYSRTTDDYEAMALADFRAVVEPSFWLGRDRTSVGTYMDYFFHLTEFEPGRAARYGIQHYCAIAVNPKEANNLALSMETIDAIESSGILDDPRVVAVGEVGFDRVTEAEEKVLVRQLHLAARKNLPVIVHSPHVEKLRGVRRIVEIIRAEGLDPTGIVLDHNTEETIGVTRSVEGIWAGLTVYPWSKLTPERAAGILKGTGTERMLVNTSSDWGPSHPLNLPRTVRAMLEAGFTRKDAERVVWENPLAFFSRSGRFVVAGED